MREMTKETAAALAAKIKQDWWPNDVRFDVTPYLSPGDLGDIWRIKLTAKYGNPNHALAPTKLVFDFADGDTPSHTVYMAFVAMTNAFGQGYDVGRSIMKEKFLLNIEKMMLA